MAEDKKGLYLHFEIFQSNEPVIYGKEKEKEKNIQNFFITEKDSFLFINRDTYNINTYSNHNEHEDGEAIVFKVERKDGSFILINSFKSIASSKHDIDIIKNHKIWFLINNKDKNKFKDITNENDDYYLCENDIIKLGAELYIVRKININKKEDSIKNQGGENDNKSNKIYDIQTLNKKSEKIKFDTCYEIQDLSNCNLCDHILEDLNNKKETIKDWIKINMVTCKDTTDKKVKSYKFTLKKCNECNKIYPLRYKNSEGSEIIDLSGIEEPENKDYIILESIEQIDEEMKYNAYYKYIHIIELTKDKEEIKIGRDKDNDVIDNNCSISREQAIIEFNKNEKTLLLKNLSDRGTCVLIKDDLKISDKKEIYLREGNLYFYAKIIDKKEFDIKDKEEKEKAEKREKQDEEIKKKINEKENARKEKEKELYAELEEEDSI